MRIIMTYKHSLLPFIQENIDVLSSFGEVLVYRVPGIKKIYNIFAFIRQLWHLITHKYDLYNRFFNDYHAVLPVLFSRLRKKKSILVIVGFNALGINNELFTNSIFNSIRRDWCAKIDYQKANFTLPVTQGSLNEFKKHVSTDDRQAISSFYNEFKKKQALTGVNLRHYIVFNECIKAGLRRNYNVLEIGCGIGTFTQLLCGYVKDGYIVATDISNESIEEAEKKLKSSGNITLHVSDMSDFTTDLKFDFVVMVDVLEHIPFEQYDQLFSTINACTHENSILAMNIPHPDMIRHLRKNHPESLQIIDNSVDMDFLSKHIYNNGFMLSGYKPYCIHNSENDYVYMTFEKKSKKKKFAPISKLKIKKRKLFFKLKYYLSLWFYR